MIHSEETILNIFELRPFLRAVGNLVDSGRGIVRSLAYLYDEKEIKVRKQESNP